MVCAHGGGFIVNNPAVDDPLARYLADTCLCVVVSIDYRKCPQNKFPTAYEDVVELSLAAINDQELPLDRSKVVLFGSSAGGNLILAAAQNPRLRPKVMGVMTLYPPCDLVPTAKEKLSTRPDPSIPDFLGLSYDNIGSLYLGNDPNLEDARVSPGRFSAREDLPDRVFLLGCEHDMLCDETEVMADRLARALPKTHQDAYGWQAGGVRWHKIKGQLHGFDHFPKKSPDEEKLRLAVRESTYQLMSQWLLEGFKDTLSQ